MRQDVLLLLEEAADVFFCVRQQQAAPVVSSVRAVNPSV